MRRFSRRDLLVGGGGVMAAALARPAIAQDTPLRIGLMLPFSGPDSDIGEAIAAAFHLRVRELGFKMGGRPVEIVRVDDQSNPKTAQTRVNQLLGTERADVMVGTVDSGVLPALIEAAHDQTIPLIIPNAGDDSATREHCAPSVFRSSFSNWQPSFGMGKALAATGVKKAAWLTWDNLTGKQSGDGFRDGLRGGGAELVQTLSLPFPSTDFAPLLGALRALGVEAVGACFAGDGAARFIKAYAASGLRENLPLCGPGFLTEGVARGLGKAAEGLRTALHYGDGIANPGNLAFRAAFKSFAGRDADVYAVHGYDAARMLAIGLNATRGDPAGTAEFAAALCAATIDSPRGGFTLSASHNPVQTIWLREVKAGENQVIGAAAQALADPGTGCHMA